MLPSSRRKLLQKRQKLLFFSLPKPPFELLDHEDGLLVGQEVLDAHVGGLVASSEHAEITHTQKTADNYIWISICKCNITTMFLVGTIRVRVKKTESSLLETVTIQGYISLFLTTLMQFEVTTCSMHMVKNVVHAKRY